jgi:predicted membrane channel-forming protein YqfA (hemolysin III family)
MGHLAVILTVGAISIGSLWSIYSSVVTVCSFLHTTLPPYEFLADYPRVQAAYKVSLYVIGYIALNARSTVYHSLSTNDGTKLSAAAVNGKP